MCIIVVKPRGHALPTWATLETCFNNNPDGAGYMYSGDDGLVHIRKGFMDWADFKRSFKNEKKTFDWEKAGIVFHFRIKTHGEVSRECCHPFPISRDLKRLRMTELDCRYGIAHNGIISGMRTDARTSDTMAYIMAIVAPCMKLADNIHDENMASIITQTLGTSKLALLDGTGDIKMFGSFNEEEGIYYSNYSYDDWGAYSRYWNAGTYYYAPSKVSPVCTSDTRSKALPAGGNYKPYKYPKWDACKGCGWRNNCVKNGAECVCEDDARVMVDIVKESERGEVWSDTKHASDYGYDWTKWEKYDF